MDTLTRYPSSTSLETLLAIKHHLHDPMTIGAYQKQLETKMVTMSIDTCDSKLVATLQSVQTLLILVDKERRLMLSRAHVKDNNKFVQISKFILHFMGIAKACNYVAYESPFIRTDSSLFDSLSRNTPTFHST